MKFVVFFYIRFLDFLVSSFCFVTFAERSLRQVEEA